MSYVEGLPVLRKYEPGSAQQAHARTNAGSVKIHADTTTIDTIALRNISDFSSASPDHFERLTAVFL
jgi:hypothetical protein